MDWLALILTLKLACWTTVLLVPMAIYAGRFLSRATFRGKSLVEAVVMVPLIMPPTVLGYYLLVVVGTDSVLGGFLADQFGVSLVFSFEGLVFASIIFNLPFAIQPVQRAFEAIPREIPEAAWCAGLSQLKTFFLVEMPLAWPGVVTAVVLVFAHTMGEFGIVLMVGGSIPGETKTISISIYDQVQAFDQIGAGIMSATLLVFSLTAIWLTFTFGNQNRLR